MTPAFTHEQLVEAVEVALRPLIRCLLREGVAQDVFEQLSRVIYVEEAEKSLPLADRKQSDSRIAVVTGMTRREVARIRKTKPKAAAVANSGLTRAARVIAGWQVRHASVQGKTKHLPVEGVQNSFDALVKEFGGNVPTRAVLDELLRLGVAEISADGKTVALLQSSLIPPASHQARLSSFGSTAKEFISVMTHNLYAAQEDRLFQRRVWSTDLPAEFIPLLKAYINTHGQQLLQDTLKLIAQHDRTINPDTPGTGKHHAVVGLYMYDEEIDALSLPVPPTEASATSRSKRSTKTAGARKTNKKPASASRTRKTET